MPTTLRILILEDEPADAELVLRALRQAGYEPDWHRVDTEGEYEAALHPGLDVILADYHLPQFDALRALHLLQERGLDVPFLVVTGALGDELAAECVRQGVTDYILKDRLTRLGPAIARALEERAIRAEKLQAEKALRETTQALQAIIQASPAAIILLDPLGRVRLWNPAAERIFGWSSEEILGWSPSVVPEGAQDTFREFIERTLGGETIAGVELRLGRKDGSPVDISLSGAPLRDADGSIRGIVSIGAEITRRKAAEELLRRQRETLHHTEEVATMGQLLAGVAHELNNPLSIVLGQTTMLQQALATGPLADRVEKLAGAAQRCARIVRNFLALAPQRPPEREPVLLNEVVRGAIELLAYPLRVDTVQVRLDLAPDLPVLWADPHQLHQVVVNLLTNAHHALRQTPPPRALSITTRRDMALGRISLEVADTGPGIPAEIRERIFEPFFTTKAPGEGTGLGLSLCQGIVEGHGGTIRAASQPGGGTVFLIELPVAAPSTTAPETPAVATPAPPRGKTILVVDDEPVLAELLTDLLAAEGYSVETAANGILALQKIQEKAYDVILTDIRMPELDGPGLFRAVKERHPELSRRFVFLTGDLLTLETRQFLEQERVTSLRKPFVLEDVTRAVERALRDS